MSDDKKGRDVYYIIALVGAGIVIVGLIAGLVTIFMKQRKAGKKIETLEGMRTYIDATYGQDTSVANITEITLLQKIRDKIINVLRTVKQETF